MSAFDVNERNYAVDVIRLQIKRNGLINQWLSINVLTDNQHKRSVESDKNVY